MPKDPKEQRTADLINHNLNRAFNIPLEDKPVILPDAPASKRDALGNIATKNKIKLATPADALNPSIIVREANERAQREDAQLQRDRDQYVKSIVNRTFVDFGDSTKDRDDEIFHRAEKMGLNPGLHLDNIHNDPSLTDAEREGAILELYDSWMNK
jgi:hypothetical protein